MGRRRKKDVGDDIGTEAFLGRNIAKSLVVCVGHWIGIQDKIMPTRMKHRQVAETRKVNVTMVRLYKKRTKQIRGRREVFGKRQQ